MGHVQAVDAEAAVDLMPSMVKVHPPPTLHVLPAAVHLHDVCRLQAISRACRANVAMGNLKKAKEMVSNSHPLLFSLSTLQYQE